MQQRLLIGTYECSLDDRFRLAVPAKLRGPFADGAIVSWWLDDECLIVVPADGWDQLIAATFGTMSVLDDDQRELRRYVLAGAYPQPPLDKQGRVLIPANLREHVGLGSKVSVVGAGEYLEVWDTARLGERFTGLRKEGVSSRANRLAQRIA